MFTLLAETLAGLTNASEVKRFHQIFGELFSLGQAGATPTKLAELKTALVELLQPKLQARRANPTDDVLGMLVQAQDEQGHRLNDAQLIAHINFLVGTGHETTSSLAAWTLYLLARHPEYLQRVLDEQNQLLDLGATPTLAQLQQMTVLDNALRETERLYPPIGSGPRGVVTDFEFNGYHIPAGSFICYSISATHLIPSIFADPLNFDPDRFSPPREEHKRTPYALVGFGGGPRICIATHFVNVNLKAMISAILRAYRLEIVDNQLPVQVYRGIGMPIKGISMRLGTGSFTF